MSNETQSNGSGEPSQGNDNDAVREGRGWERFEDAGDTGHLADDCRDEGSHTGDSDREDRTDNGVERWEVREGESKTFDFDDVRKLRVAIAKGRIDVIGSDEPGCRLEVSNVRELPVEVVCDGDKLIVRDFDERQPISIRASGPTGVFKVLNWLFGRSGNNAGGHSGRNSSWVGRGVSSRVNADVSLLVPRDVAARIVSVEGDALIGGLTNGSTLNTVSGTLLADGVSGSLRMHTVSGKVEARNHHGSVDADSVSGDVIVSGDCTTITIDAVSGSLYADMIGSPQSIQVHSVSGSAFVRLDPRAHLRCHAEALSGRAEISGRRFGIRHGLDYEDGPRQEPPTTVRFSAVRGKLRIARRTAATDGTAAAAASNAGVAGRA